MLISTSDSDAEEKRQQLDAEEKRQTSVGALWTDFFAETAKTIAQVKMDFVLLKLFLIDALQQNGVAGVIGMALDICQVG